MKTLVVVLLGGGVALASGDTLRSAPRAVDVPVIIVPAVVRGMMSAVWVANNRHWDELADENTLTQLLGEGKPTQLEYLGCLTGDVVRDTLWVRGLAAAADLKQLQFAVAGNCDHVDRLVGSWHTHPYRADPHGHALKERGLSAMDLATFRAARDRVTMVMWDRDSLDVAVKTASGTVLHPAAFAVR